MKRYWKNIVNYLSFSRGERNATILLAFILVLFMLFPYLYRNIFDYRSQIPDEIIAQADSFFTTLKYNPTVNAIEPLTGIEAEINPPKQVHLFHFDPNTISLDSLIELGLSRKQAEVFVKYRLKGGKFRTADDLDKIYVLDSALNQKLKPLVQIITHVDSIHPTERVSEPITIELNSADTISLLKLKGIGKNFAKRIVSYRTLLGGFYSIEQLTEVYGITNELLEQIRPSIWVDSLKIQYINLNLVRYEELRAHPYISNYQAKAIVYYRSQKGSIKTVDELWQNKLIPWERFVKLKPYLVLE